MDDEYSEDEYPKEDVSDISDIMDESVQSGEKENSSDIVKRLQDEEVDDESYSS